LNFEFLVLNYFLDTLVKSAALVFCEELNPDEIRATKISSRLNRRRVSKRAHLTGQVGQAGQADHHGYTQIIVCCMRFVGQGSVSLYSFLQVIFYRCDSIIPDKTAFKQPSQLLTFLFVNEPALTQLP